jgi:hypothetical protein
LDYASNQTPRRPADRLRFAPFFAVVCAAFAWMKSCQYHAIGQLSDEQVSTLIFIILSLPCLIITLARLRRYRSHGRAKWLGAVLLCAAVLIANVLALWNLHTATGYRLF